MERKDDHTDSIELKRQINELRNENLRLRALLDEYKNKEQSISNAIIASIEHANQLEASRKKLYTLDIQRSRLMYLRMEQVINELYRKYPELKKDMKLKDLSERFKSMVYNDLNEKTTENISFGLKKQPVIDDPIKKLLRNIIDCFETKKAEEKAHRSSNARFTTTSFATEKTTKKFISILKKRATSLHARGFVFALSETRAHSESVLIRLLTVLRRKPRIIPVSLT